MNEQIVLPTWSIDDFKEFARKQVDRHCYITPSIVVLISFYFGEVKKPKDITAQLFSWLRSIAEKEIQVYKQSLN